MPETMLWGPGKRNKPPTPPTFQPEDEESAVIITKEKSKKDYLGNVLAEVTEIENMTEEETIAKYGKTNNERTESLAYRVAMKQGEFSPNKLVRKDKEKEEEFRNRAQKRTNKIIDESKKDALEKLKKEQALNTKVEDARRVLKKEASTSAVEKLEYMDEDETEKLYGKTYEERSKNSVYQTALLAAKKRYEEFEPEENETVLFQFSKNRLVQEDLMRMQIGEETPTSALERLKKMNKEETEEYFGKTYEQRLNNSVYQTGLLEAKQTHEEFNPIENSLVREDLMRMLKDQKGRKKREEVTFVGTPEKLAKLKEKEAKAKVKETKGKSWFARLLGR